MNLTIEEKARKYTVSLLISYLIHAEANEWKSQQYAADVGRSAGLATLDHSSLSKHTKALDYAIMKQVLDVMIGKLNRAVRRRLKIPNNLLSIDSTTITVGNHGRYTTGTEPESSCTSASRMIQKCPFKSLKQPF